MPAHGLNAIPGTAASYKTFKDLTALEELVRNPLKRQATDLDMVSFSNNIGFYNMVFHAPSANPTASNNLSAKAGTATVKSQAELRMSAVKTSANNIRKGQVVQVSAELQNGSQPVSGLTVTFYDGDPATGGKAFDVERIPYINANGRYEVNVNYRALNCGAHRLFAKAGAGKAYEVTSGSSVLQVDCPTVCVSKACMRSSQYYALNLNRLPQGSVKVAGNSNNTRVSTDDVVRMRVLLQGGTSRLHQLNQQYVAAQLSLLAAQQQSDGARQQPAMLQTQLPTHANQHGCSPQP